MDRMPCGVTADLRQYEREQAQSSALWDAYAEGIAQYWTDNVMEGGYAYGKHWSLKDFREEITDDEFSFLMSATRNQALDRYDDVKKKLLDRIFSFFMEHCQDDIWEAIGSGDE